MRQTVNIYFNVARILSLIFGIIFCITLIGAIIGIPMIIASKRFGEASNMTDELLVANRTSILGWGIFLAIVFSPTIFGLILLLMLTFMVDNYIKNIEQGNAYKNDVSFSDAVDAGVSNVVNGVKSTFSKNKTNLDKQKEELVKLDKMKEDGLISRAEYEALRKKILGLD